mmetsp:Transcript_32196/g.45785  ORF Transcript_32196/g.45785 Transcript_32196/m.45785 type:complete len:366 (+) Transcript_32196:164-1261(+)|eukprot:CAMPEP_0202446256 /NCGR_PEP_ID=MMETSP1360-20130828/4814_1 /ASSEMBLY_ACC=CAM_ASM_000848 /TAXON_ID=515479 /ORGANISM="Licmophora paradoxa, Strain CCMP2313" /LENGTH=365 /DNA_ID=CAMNT_0049062701 /DNA_START=51 /DNA_END=1148 /DNA_ORIENTATION=-
MKSMIGVLLFLLGISRTSASTAFSRGAIVDASGAVFAMPRGGGLFGGKNKEETDASGAEVSAATAAATATAAGMPTYPAMSREEVEGWLDHIPVFAVTDSQGQGVVLRPDDNTSVFYFFMSPLMANATLTQLKSSGGAESMDLRVSAFSLGKIWFNVLNASPDKEVVLKTPGEEDGKKSSGVEYRLVPDTRDLLGARMLLTMNPEDGEKLKNGEEMTQEIAQAAIKKAMTEAPKFNATFNEIPVFLIAQMRMQKQPEEGEEVEGESVTLMPMYFSLQNMVTTWQQFMSQAPPEVQGTEPAINLMALHELVDMMQKECPIDFRNVVLVPPTPIAEGGASGASVDPAASMAAADPMASMGGSTLGDL